MCGFFLKAQNITIVPRDRSKRYSDSSFLITPLELLSLSSRVEEPFSHMILIPDPVYPLLCLFISPVCFQRVLYFKELSDNERISGRTVA